MGSFLTCIKYATFPSSETNFVQKHLANIKEESRRLTPSNNSMNHSLLAYGEFDRINIEKITDFTRFRDIDKHTQRWLGPRQSVLLYQICEEDTLLDLFFSSVDEKSQLVNQLLVLSVATIDPVLHQQVPSSASSEDIPFEAVLKECRKLIIDEVGNQVTSNNTALKCPQKIRAEVYGSFSSSELAIVWLVEQYTDALYLVDQIRFLSMNIQNGKPPISPFLSFYPLVAQASIKGKNRTDSDNENSKVYRTMDGPWIYGDAEIRFLFQDGVQGQEDRAEYFKEIVNILQTNLEDRWNQVSIKKPSKLPSITSYSSVGEYDYCIRLPADLICASGSSLFHSDGLLHRNNEAFRKQIMRTQSHLYYTTASSEPVEDATTVSTDKDSSQCVINRSENSAFFTEFNRIKQKVYGSDTPIGEFSLDDKYFSSYLEYGLRKIFKEIFPETAGLCDTLDLIYLDYVNNCSNLTNVSWAQELSTQFEGVLDYIASETYLYRKTKDKLNKTKAISSDKLLNEISTVFNDFKQTVYHIAQSRRTFFVVPSCHLRYMGQYDLILRAYYGLQKYLLRLAYQLDSTDKQPELIPLYTIDVVSEIMSRPYRIPSIDNSIKGKAEDPSMKALFTVNMPLTAMVDFLRYSMSITHETFHLVTPRDRNKRNQVAGLLSYAEIGVHLFLDGVFEWMKEEKDPLENEFLVFVYDKVAISLLPFFYIYGKNHYSLIHGCILKQFDELRKSSPEYYAGNYPIWEIYCKIFFQLVTDWLTGPFGFLQESYIKILQETGGKIKEKLSELFDICEKSFFQQKEFYDAKAIESLKRTFMTKATAYLPNKDDISLGSRRCIIRSDGTPDGSLVRSSTELIAAYREASQDLPMVRLFGLSFVDYLVFRDKHKQDILDYGQENSREDQYRISMLCDYLISSDYYAKNNCSPTPQAVLEIFGSESNQKAYVNLMYPVSVAATDDQKTQEKNRQLFLAAYENTRRNLAKYFETLTTVRNFLKNLLKDADITIDQPPAVQEMVDNAYLSTAYKNWKAAVQEESLDNYHKALFQNNLNLIHYFQDEDNVSVKNALVNRNKKREEGAS